MGREVVQTALALLPEIDISEISSSEIAEHNNEGGGPGRVGTPLIQLLPSIKRTVTLGFHGQSAEKIAEISPLVAMLLKGCKSVNGSHKCSLVSAAAEVRSCCCGAAVVVLSCCCADLLLLRSCCCSDLLLLRSLVSTRTRLTLSSSVWRVRTICQSS